MGNWDNYWPCPHHGYKCNCDSRQDDNSEDIPIAPKPVYDPLTFIGFIKGLAIACAVAIGVLLVVVLPIIVIIRSPPTPGKYYDALGADIWILFLLVIAYRYFFRVN